MKFKETDLLDLASSLKVAIELHEVKPELQDSLLSDILFQVANLIDEKQDSELHEEIFGLLENLGQSGFRKEFKVLISHRFPSIF
jgi:hypothetical protein